MDHASSPPCPLLGELLVRVLQHLDLKQRLGACALVNHSWAAAAATATTDITVTLQKQPNNTILHSLTERWLPKHGGHVSGLSVVWPKQYRLGTHTDLCLPFTQLQQLHTLCLKGLRLLDAGAAGSSASTAAEAAPATPAVPTAPGSSSLTGSSSSSGQPGSSLAPLTSLTSLQLEDVDIGSCSGGLSALIALQQLHLKPPCSRASNEDAWIASLSPLHHLQELKLEGSSFKASPALLSQLPLSLTLLVAKAHRVQLSSSSAARLGHLTGLQHLELCGLRGIQQETLSSLVALTHLKLDHLQPLSVAGGSCVGPLSCLQQLKELSLMRRNDACRVSPAAVPALPPNITMLEFDWTGELSGRTAPAIAQLTGLQHLKVNGEYTHSMHNDEALTPLVIEQLQHLRHLALAGVSNTYLPALLRQLSQLQQLEHLAVTFHSICLPPLADVQQYSLLVSSSHLTCLDLHHVELPEGAGGAMFAAGRQLPALRELNLGYNEYLYRGSVDMDATQPIGPGDVCSLVACCPGLEELNLAWAVQPGVQFSSLVQLSGLTGLALAGDSVDDDLAELVLAKLLRLRSLMITKADSLTDVGLSHLTQLTGLTGLFVNECGLSKEVLESQGVVFLRSEAPQPDVWQQLHEVCKHSSACLCIILEQRERQLAAAAEGAKQQVASLEQQLAHAQAQLAASQAQLAASQAQVVQLQQQLGRA